MKMKVYETEWGGSIVTKVLMMICVPLIALMKREMIEKKYKLLLERVEIFNRYERN